MGDGNSVRTSAPKRRRTHLSRETRFKIFGAIAFVAVAAIGLAIAYAVGSARDAEAAQYKPHVFSTPTTPAPSVSETPATPDAACTAVRDLNNARNDATPVSDGKRVAVILGDSYAQGQWLDDARNDAWSTLLGQQEKWKTFVNGSGGSGFAFAGPCGDQAFGQRVDAVLAHDPSVVIVEGGVNDLPGTVAAPAKKLLEALANVKTVIVIGPVAAPGFDADNVSAVDKELSAVVEATGRTYVSMVGADVEIGPDHRHMTAAGHAQYAKIVAAAIR